MVSLRKLFIALLILGSCLHAAIHPDSGEYAFQGSLLYLFPDVGPTYFVFNSSTPAADTSSTAATGSFKQNSFGFKPGFRLEAAYGLCNAEIRAEWTRLSCSTRRSISSASMDPTMTDQGGPRSTGGSGTFPGIAVSNLSLGYNEVSLLVANNIFGGCAFFSWLRGGIQYAYMGHRDSRKYLHTADGSLEVTTINSRFWGVGPEVALASCYHLCNWQECESPSTLTIETLISGSLLVSQTSSQFKYYAFGSAVTPSNFHGHDAKKWMIVPAWHAQIGLNYDMRLGCWAAAIELGYEFTVYNDAISQVSGFAKSVGESRTFYYNFTNHGPYLALGAVF